MTIAAMKQALEAIQIASLRCVSEAETCKILAANTALRAAIAEQEKAEPVAIVDDAGVIIVCSYSYKPGDKLFTHPAPVPAGWLRAIDEAMSKTAQLLALAEAATKRQTLVSGVSQEMMAFSWAANPETIKQLVELVRLQHEALLRFETHYECEDTFYSCPSHETAWEDRKGECCCGADGANEAIEAFNNFERNL